MKIFSYKASLAAVALFLGGCDGDGIPRPVAGYYSLATVNGQPVPIPLQPSLGLGFSVRRGDLILRPDNTFSHGMGGTVAPGGIITGTYRRSGEDLTLLWQLPGEEPQEVTGSAFGDSVVLHLTDFSGARRFSYRRVQHPTGQDMSGVFRLTQANGRTGQPVVLLDTTINGWSYLSTATDSLLFTENLFVRRHRSEHTVITDPEGHQTASAQEWTADGAFDHEAQWLRLEFYSLPPFPGLRAVDSLLVTGDTLVRRTPTVFGMREERYTRR